MLEGIQFAASLGSQPVQTPNLLFSWVRGIRDAGEFMPRYLSLHTLACLTRQGAEELTARLSRATQITTRRVLMNMVEGKMLVEFEAADRETLEQWLVAEGFHYDWVLRVEFESAQGRLVGL